MALTSAFMCSIIEAESTCRWLNCDALHRLGGSAYLGMSDTFRRRLLALCSHLRQAGIMIMKHLRGQDGNLHQHRPVICRASMEASFRWTTTHGTV